MLNYKYKIAFFTALYIFSSIIIFIMRHEIGIAFGVIADLWGAFYNFLKLEWATLLTILVVCCFKICIYLFLLLVSTIKWFIVVVKLSWLNLFIFLPAKRAVIYTLSQFTIVDKLKDKGVDLFRDKAASVHSEFISWPVPLRLYSLPAVSVFLIMSFLFFLFLKTVKLLIANKLGDKVVEIFLRKFVMKFPATRAKIQPILDQIEKRVKTIEDIL